MTEEFHPGFRNSVASYTVSAAQPEGHPRSALHAHGLRIVERALRELPAAAGRALSQGRRRRDARRKSRNSPPAMPSAATPITPRLRARRRRAAQPGAAGRRPTSPWKAGASFRELLKAAPLGAPRSGSMLETRGALASTSSRSRPAICSMRWFESDAVQGGARLRRHRRQPTQSPYAPGSAYVLLHHVFGEVNGKRGVWGHAIGGMGAITQAMAKCAQRAASISAPTAPVGEADRGERPRRGRRDGERRRRYAAKIVVANLNPRLLLHADGRSGGAAGGIPPRAWQHWRCGSGTFRMNVALSELPDFTALPGQAPAAHHSAGIIIGPSLDYMDRAFLDAQSAWLVEGAGHRDADPFHPRRHARPAGAACREPLLPARRAGRFLRIFPAAVRGTTTRRRSPT